jgi:outer membrane lipoprotein LolB
MRSELLRFGAAVTLATLAACKTTPAPPVAPSAPWSERKPALQAQDHFAFNGRVAVAAAGNGFNANLRWKQAGERAQITLEGPLGIGGVQITVSADDLQVVTANGEHISRDAAQNELRARLGFDVPFASLRYWVRGVPDPADAAEETLDEAQQRLSALVQQGWHVQYLDYMQATGEALPARMTLERDSVRVRLLVDVWQP